MPKQNRHRFLTEMILQQAAPYGVTSGVYSSGPRPPLACPVTSSVNTTVAWYKYKIMDDVVLDNFIELQAAGSLLETNPLVQSSIDISSTGLSHLQCSYHQSGSGASATSLNNMAWRGSFLSSPSLTGTVEHPKYWVTTSSVGDVTIPPSKNPFTSTDYANMADIAMTSAYANIGSAEFEMGILIGEAKETGLYLVKNYKRIARSYLAFLNRASAKQAELIRKAKGWSTYAEKKKGTSDEFHKWWTSSYLEFRFAIMPLVTEFFNFLEADLTKNIVRQTARGIEVRSVNTQKAFTYSVGTNAANPWGKLSYVVQRTESWKVETRGHVTYDCELSDGLAAIRNLGFTKPLSVIYDLTRLSFVVDYFINLGNYIESLAFNIGVKQQVGGYSQETTYTSSTTVTYTGQPILLDNWIQPSQLVIWKQKKRFPVNSPPLLPTIDVDLSLTKVVDLFALARGIIRSL